MKPADETHVEGVVGSGSQISHAACVSSIQGELWGRFWSLLLGRLEEAKV